MSNTEGTTETNIGLLNPFRYRSYYYDTETGLYYLQSRYYDPEIGRFISADDVSYLDPETLNGLNLYAYCGNNPVMNVDPDGQFFVSFLIASIIIGAAISGTLNGISAYNDGQRGWGLFGAIAGGAVMGGAMGAVMALGGAAGLASMGVSVAGFGMTAGAAFGISLGIGAGGGAISYTLENCLRDDKQWTGGGFILSGVMGGFQAATTFGLAFAGGKAGLFTNKLTSMSGTDFMMHVLNTTGKVTNAQATVYATQLVFSSVIAKLVFSSAPGALARWLIEKMIKG